MKNDLLFASSPEVKEIVEAFGLDSSRVFGIQFSVSTGGVADLYVRMHVTEDQGKDFAEVLKKVSKKFKLVPIDEKL